MGKVIKNLSDNVYVTFDIDAVDISEIRSVGTPEPGGLRWNQIIEFLEKLSKSGKNFVNIVHNNLQAIIHFLVAPG